MAAIQRSLVPTSWLRAWYICSLLIFIPDCSFVILRPRSLPGGDLAYLFEIFNVYAEIDLLFSDTQDRTLKFIYTLNGLDILFIIILMLCLRGQSHRPGYAVACICREVFLFTKTFLYILYSWQFILPSWRLSISLLNSLWCVIPVTIVLAVHNRLTTAFDKLNSTASHKD